MSELLVDQYARLLDALPLEAPWSKLIDSGFLDLMVPENEGGGGASLTEVFDIAFETGRRPSAPPIIETMIARLFRRDALAVTNLEEFSGRALSAACVSALMSGAMAEIQAMTIEYATTRRQFGREIGRFQAVQQQLAIMAEEVGAARMAAQLAFSGLPEDVSETRAGIAKYRCSQAARQVTSIAHAVHGAMGISGECQLHYFTRKLRMWCFLHGGESWWAERLGEAVFASKEELTTVARLI